MKNIRKINPFAGRVIITLILLGGGSANAGMQECTITLTVHKTTTLVFPSPVETIDRGTSDLLIQRVKNLRNVLQLKAARTDFAETNLTVLTAEGRLHNFTVAYSSQPEYFQFQILEDGQMQKINTGAKLTNIFRESQSTEQMLERAAKILNTKVTAPRVRRKKDKLSFSINNIYAVDGLLYFHLALDNTANIAFNPLTLRFLIRDKKVMKRAASQQVELKPLFQTTDQLAASPHSSAHCIVVFEKFALRRASLLEIDLHEGALGRSISLDVLGRHILTALPLPE